MPRTRRPAPRPAARPSPRRADQAAATRARLLDAARTLFDRQGFDETSLRDVAAEAGVAVGTVFVHFADKAELLHAALFEDLEKTLDQSLAKIPRGPLAKRMGFVADAVFDYYERRPELSRTLLRESLFAGGEWAKRFQAQHARVHAAVAALVEEARSRGEVERRADGALVGLAFLSFFQFALMAWVQQAHPAPRAWLEKLLKQHLDGVRPDPRSAR